MKRYGTYAVTITENDRAIRKVGRLLRKHGIVYRDIEIGRNANRDETYAVVTLASGRKVTGAIKIQGVDKAYIEVGATGVIVEDTFIAKCLMLHD